MGPLEWLSLEEPTFVALAVAVLHAAVAGVTTGHILLTKESPRSAAGWAALVWLSPLLGALAYVMLGVNRVARKASRLRSAVLLPARTPGEALAPPSIVSHLVPMRTALDAISGRPLVGGNAVVPLRDGDETFPAMLEAIEQARVSITMMTFIFDRDAWGLRFVDALARARERGVEVRLLIDGVGTWFSWPPVLGALRRAGVPYARFLWSLNPARMALLNLRNHRKVLVVDGLVAFTGGMNVRGSFFQAPTEGPRTADQDLHFRVKGPVVTELQDLFAADWAFTTGEVLEG
ncbi:MAG: cardiolipin synthase, partial [Myxococcales bacterium]|nr:cardiolipin synthase [Myxococcales bacterium]